MAYAAEELFATLQGEDVRAGRAAVFCRFAGCNLWSGHEEDRQRQPAGSSQAPFAASAEQERFADRTVTVST